MKPYFAEMTDFGKELKKGQLKRSEENIVQVKAVEADVAEARFAQWHKRAFLDPAAVV